MKQRIIIGLIVGVIVTIAIWMFFSNDQAEAPSRTEEVRQPGSFKTVTSSQSASVSETFSGTGSFLDLMQIGRGLECTFQSVALETKGAVAGTARMVNDRLRADFQMQQAGVTYDSHLIHDGSHFYTWTQQGEEVFAVKLKLEAGTDVAIDRLRGPVRSVSLASDVEYECQVWNIDASVFEPPVDIEFMTSQ